jgi:hypothetical protein
MAACHKPKMKENIMLKSILTPALIALSFAGAANAAQPSNDAQLAASAGVAVGQYSASELQLIIEARKDNDASALSYYLSGVNRADHGAGDTSGQMAKLAGVQSGSLTAADLTNLNEARKDNDLNQAAFILSGVGHNAPAAADVVTPGKAQLAAALGLDPAAHTLSQLAALTALAND